MEAFFAAVAVLRVAADFAGDADFAAEGRVAVVRGVAGRAVAFRVAADFVAVLRAAAV